MRFPLYRARWCAWLPLMLGFLCCALAGAQQVDEYRAKVALLYNFAKFVRWPDDAFAGPDAPFVFAVLGKNPFGDKLKALENKSMHGRRIEIRHYGEARDFAPCQVLYTTRELLDQLRHAHPDLLEKNHVLTVGEKENFVRGGGLLQLTFADEHLAFIINRGAARRARLEISARLFELALQVIEEAN